VTLVAADFVTNRFVLEPRTIKPVEMPANNDVASFL
jgi:hypothetical protein